MQLRHEDSLLNGLVGRRKQLGGGSAEIAHALFKLVGKADCRVAQLQQGLLQAIVDLLQTLCLQQERNGENTWESRRSEQPVRTIVAACYLCYGCLNTDALVQVLLGGPGG